MTRVGVLVGLAGEARLLARGMASSPSIACAGADGTRARQAARHLVEEGSQVLLSFGLGGGLSPALAPGDIVVADRVVLPDGRVVATDPALAEALVAGARALGLRAAAAAVAGVDRPVLEASSRAALAAQSGARAVDMESHALAECAVASGVPLAVVRAVADRAADSLPPLVDGVIDARGRARIGRLVLALARRPGALGPLMRLDRQRRAGFRSLRRVVDGGVLAALERAGRLRTPAP